ncbi:hypothetical protein NP590_07855 [Methylomonas sp. SURF-2]|uniref:Uncharacterized protein n=1 Tax=Methylomonas subterranea TaxID=2952225 RepID=A0ABT1TGW5_9GAMM|nr:hypothetical protein [Methylomonas sp. SURF-2]MCQ8104014.1 hypothetical protein [Methylomonas sp. SURF-2]
MKPLFRLFAHLLFAVGMLALYLLPAKPYEWMAEFDPVLAAAPEDLSGDNRVFAFLCLLVIAATQAGLMATSRGRLERRVCMGLILTAAVFWAAKFCF